MLAFASLDAACRLRLFPVLPFMWSGFPHSPCRWFLAQNPPALAKLEDELGAAGLLKSPKNPIPRSFTYGDIGKLHWLDCCIKVRASSADTFAMSRICKCWSLRAIQEMSAVAICSVRMPSAEVLLQPWEEARLEPTAAKG